MGGKRAAALSQVRQSELKAWACLYSAPARSPVAAASMPGKVGHARGCSGLLGLSRGRPALSSRLGVRAEHLADLLLRAATQPVAGGRECACKLATLTHAHTGM